MTKGIMAENKEADRCGIGFHSQANITGSEKDAVATNNYSTELESIKSIVVGLVGPGKALRCYRCFACKRHFGAVRLSTALVVCHHCLKVAKSKGRQARQNQIDRIMNDIRIFLCSRMEVR